MFTKTNPMKPQSYESHIRFYPPHHFVFYPVTLILLGVSAYYAVTDAANTKIWIFISSTIALVIWSMYMVRQHYALILQNRIVRDELQYRYYVLTNKRLDLVAPELNDSQLFALRFAPDAELPDLVRRTVAENLSGTAIKKSIVNWFPDHNRV